MRFWRMMTFDTERPNVPIGGWPESPVVGEVDVDGSKTPILRGDRLGNDGESKQESCHASDNNVLISTHPQSS
jgi:hypothetical protein